MLLMAEVKHIIYRRPQKAVVVDVLDATIDDDGEDILV